jgi:hypothetical protein
MWLKDETAISRDVHVHTLLGLPSSSFFLSVVTTVVSRESFVSSNQLIGALAPPQQVTRDMSNHQQLQLI